MLIKFRFRRMLWTLVFLSMFGLLVGLLYYGFVQADMTYCFFEEYSFSRRSMEPGSTNLSTLRRLEDVLAAEKMPTPGRTIYFHETSCRQPEPSLLDTVFGWPQENMDHRHKVELTVRQACAIESAALHNPNFDVFVLFASPAYLGSPINDSIFEAILTYPNVHLRNLNIWSYAAGTPIYDWLKKGLLFRSRHVLVHTADFLRLVTLWRWGGTHLDLDTITVNSFETIPPNYVGVESDIFLGNSVLNLAPTGFGHEMATKFLDQFEHTFNGNNWAYNGPGAITRVMRKMCETEDLALMAQRKGCLGFRVFATNAFYEISWPEWNRLFDGEYSEEVIERTRNSYSVHFWNKLSKHTRVRKGSDAPYSLLAERHCPKVYAAAGEYF